MALGTPTFPYVKNGTAGNDTITITQSGFYTSDLGAGNDSFYDDYPSQVTVTGGTGNDTVYL
jgi:hypothetical protein